MRNFVFKLELEYLFTKHSIPPDERENILSALLIDSHNMALSDKGPVFYLSYLESNLIELIQTKTSNQQIASEFLELLRPTDDLIMPIGLKDQILKGQKVAVFVGAGVSKLLGYPLWGELGNAAINFLRNENQIDDFQCNRILHDVTDPKQKLSILENFLGKTSGGHGKFYDSHFSKHRIHPDGKDNPYEILVDPVFSWIKVTSNIDPVFANSLAAKLNQRQAERVNNPETQTQAIIDPKELIVFNENNFVDLRNDRIYHLHGSISHSPSITFTTSDYLKKYYQSSPTRKFLKTLFEEYTVVFIGYGLEELQILESVIGEKIKTNQPHYALAGAYLNELSFFSIRRKYFKTLNIELLHYYLDFERHDRLITVLQNWRSQLLERRGEDFHGKVDFMENILGNAE